MIGIIEVQFRSETANARIAVLYVSPLNPRQTHRRHGCLKPTNTDPRYQLYISRLTVPHLEPHPDTPSPNLLPDHSPGQTQEQSSHTRTAPQPGAPRINHSKNFFKSHNYSIIRYSIIRTQITSDSCFCTDLYNSNKSQRQFPRS